MSFPCIRGDGEACVEHHICVPCYPLAAAPRICRRTGDHTIRCEIVVQNLEYEVVVVVCTRLFTSGRESHGWPVTGVKESLVGGVP